MDGKRANISGGKPQLKTPQTEPLENTLFPLEDSQRGKRNAPFLIEATTTREKAALIKGSGWSYTQTQRNGRNKDQRKNRGRSGTMGSYSNQHPYRGKGVD